MSHQRTALVGARRAVPVAGPWLFGVLALVGALLLGAVAALGNLLIVGFVVTGMGVVLALGFPRTLFSVALVGSMVVVGLLELYLPGLQVLRWAAAGAASLFLVAVALRQFGTAPASAPAQGQPALTWAMLGFIGVFAASTLLNWHNATLAMAGTKNYFQAWGLFFGLVLMTRWPGLDRSLPKVLLAVALLQLPLVLHQFLFLVPLRDSLGGLTSVDVVAGSFGASLTGGGNNAMLAMFLIVVITVLVAVWRTGALRAAWLWLLVPLLIPIFLNESKISVVYLLLAFGIVFRREILKRPLRVAVMSLLLLGIAFGLSLTYAAFNKYSRATTPIELVEEIFRQNTQAGERYGNLSLNRTTALVHWFDERRRYPLANALLGHGPSESKISSGLLDISNNLASRRYAGLGIGLTSVSSLLWDFGVAGLVATFAVFAAAYSLAGKLARAYQGARYRAGLFEGLQAGVVIMALSLFHKSAFTFHLGYQVFVLTLLGFLVYSWRYLNTDDSKARR